MLYVLVALLLLITRPHGLSAGAVRGCCHPDKMMGEMFLVELQRTIFFAVDFSAGRFYRTADSTGNWYNVVDFPSKRMYTSSDGSCSVEEAPGLPDQVQCMTADQMAGTYRLGEESQDLHLDAFEYLRKGKYVWKTVTYQGGHCYPVTEHAQADGSNRTMIYSKLQPFTDFDKLYVSFDDCKQ